MSLPHHHVFNAVQPQIQEGVPVKKIIPLLQKKSIIKKQQADIARKGGRINGMKIICGYIKNQSFETFLKFVQCMCELMSTDPECDKTVSPVLASIVEVVKDFDVNYHTEHAKSIIDIIKPYQTPFGEETTKREEEEQKALAESKSLSVEGDSEAAAAMAISQPIIKPYETPIEEEATEREEDQEELAMAEKFKSSLTLESDSEAAAAATLQPSAGHSACLGVFPDLPYVTRPEQATFNSRGGRYYNSDWEFAIDVPAGAVPEDQEVTIKMAACAYGPFDIPENYHIASGFICLVANKPFLEAVNLTLEHCLVRSDEQDDSSVVILRSDHSVVSEGKYRFLPLPNTPDISYETKTLSFQLKELCILCGAGENKESDQPQSSQDHDDSMMDTSSVQDDNKLCVNLGKKRSRSTESLGPDKSRRKITEYAVFFFEPPLCRRTYPFNVLAFVCHKCTVAMKECQKQAKHKLELHDAQPYELEFKFGHTKYIKFSLERKRTPEWSVSLKGQEWVSEDSINKYTMPLNQHDQKCLQIDLEEGFYPPLRVYEVCWSTSTPPKKSLKIEAKVHNIDRTHSPQDYLSYKITASAGGAYCSGCKKCQSQDARTPDVERVRRLMERVKNELSDSQKNLEAKEYHLAAGAFFVQNFPYLCRVLELSDTEAEQIKYDNPPDHDRATELPYQALCKWKRMRTTTTVNNLATVLASAGEVNAVNHLFQVLSQRF